MIKQNEDKKPIFKGEILLCEDNELMQRIIKSSLEDIGFEVTVANNGKECVEIVSERETNGKTPFGLIFMDIYMPVMDGIEAADALTNLGNISPIAALTANTEFNDIEKYEAHNMPHSLNKPFVPEELWSFLYKYFTPLSFDSNSQNNTREEEKRIRLLTGFVKRNQTTFADISTAIETGDIKLAHRLAHTLKGLAGLMGEIKLLEAANVVEYALAEEDMEHITGKMAALERELKPVLDELAPLLEEAEAQPVADSTLDKAKVTALFEKLEQLLRADSSKCRELTGELRGILGTSDLIEQIEDYEFEKALEILIKLKA